MAGMLRVSRTRGAMSGVLLVLLGIWGGLIPLVGPYVHYAYTPNHTWTITSGRIWLEFLPAAGTFLGGLILLTSKFRPMALLGGSLAAASGAWFAVGSALAPLWTHNLHAQGFPIGGHIARAMEQIGFFPGLGVVIAAIASCAGLATCSCCLSHAGWPSPHMMRRVASSKGTESAESGTTT